jgi:hypothetical protein
MPNAGPNAYNMNHNSGPAPPPSAPLPFPDAPQNYQYQYSQCTGKRKALLIGINYFGQRGQLRGCINDVRNMSAYLVEHYGYKREDMVILTDDQQNPMSQPTKQNILRAMHWLVKDAKPNDSLFFHYSGAFYLALRKGPQRPIADTLLARQGMEARPRTSTATSPTDTTRSSTQSISGRSATSRTMRCTGSW